jgi:hypothetical protein
MLGHTSAQTTERSLGETMAPGKRRRPSLLRSVDENHAVGVLFQLSSFRRRRH